jgi:hypothetical protein
MNCSGCSAMVHVTTCDELRALLMAHLFNGETYIDGEDQ